MALIAIYAAVLAAATFVETKYGGAAAQFAVYDTGWFTAIHVLLAVNVLCAMLSRLPWRRRQIGFVMTHGGILVLLIGCAITWAGIEAQLPVYEGHANHVAYEESLHFELDVHHSGKADDHGQRTSAENGIITVPFEPGPFSWNDDRMASWFPWCLGHRSQGIVYNSDGITLDVLDYTEEPNPTARIRLTIDGKAEAFKLTASSAEAAPKGQRASWSAKSVASRFRCGKTRCISVSTCICNSFDANSIQAAECRRTTPAKSTFSNAATRRKSLMRRENWRRACSSS